MLILQNNMTTSISKLLEHKKVQQEAKKRAFPGIEPGTTSNSKKRSFWVWIPEGRIIPLNQKADDARSLHDFHILSNLKRDERRPMACGHDCLDMAVKPPSIYTLTQKHVKRDWYWKIPRLQHQYDNLFTSTANRWALEVTSWYLSNHRQYDAEGGRDDRNLFNSCLTRKLC
jgi:hypothetical protein